MILECVWPLIGLMHVANSGYAENVPRTRAFMPRQRARLHTLHVLWWLVPTVIGRERGEAGGGIHALVCYSSRAFEIFYCFGS